MHIDHVLMKSKIHSVLMFIVIAQVVFVLAPGCGGERVDRPWDTIRPAPPHTDHSVLFSDSIASGPQATRLCLKCHKEAAREVMATSHWTWLSHDTPVAGHEGMVKIGKRNLINNFCIGITSNWPRCTSCHAGYGWRDDTFDFADEENVDCLVCHDQTGIYHKSSSGAGLPAGDVDLLAVVKSVGRPTRRNCGYCHFKGGGGDAVKHGDLDGTFYFPVERIDIHMGKYNLECVDCHRTERHEMAGRALSVSADASNRLECTSCHAAAPHDNERLNAHVAAVACQTCHIPRMAIGAPTKMEWDWSTAGQDLGIEDPHVYLKTKGSFVYKQNIPPEYGWYNGRSKRYLLGDMIDPEGITMLNPPQGSIHDPSSKIWPFKIHRGKQLYDKVHNYFLVPQVIGENGYWSTFDWELAARLGSEATGLAFSGEYGFARSEMHWPITHMVASIDNALQCTDCHGEGGRMKWKELGYDGDPAYRGSPRNVNLLAAESRDR
jgi:octaheme c-type cytochrome (tetrathionate reductase family)